MFAPNFLPPPLLLLLLLISSPQVSSHARMKTPPPLDGPTATDASGNAYNSPLSGTGADFPCKGLHAKPGVDKTPKVTWAAGSTAFFELVPNGAGGGEGAMAAHSGGSCQASLSYDNGATWKVLHTYQGGCPRDVPYKSNIAGPDQKFEFQVPKEAKSGDALFSWSWIAVTGNRDEYYMNCAYVKITGSGTSTLDDYEDMWVGDMNIPGRIKTGECRSKAGLAIVYPHPGPFITIKEVSGISFGPPTGGTCFVGPGKGKSSGSGSGDSGEGAGSSGGGGGGGGGGDDGSPVVTKSESAVASSPMSSAATSTTKGKTTAKGTPTTSIPRPGDGNGSVGDAPLPTTTPATTTAIPGGSGSGGGTKTTDPANGPMFSTTEEVVAPPRSLPVPKSGTKTGTGPGHQSTSSSCDTSSTGNPAAGGSISGTGSCGSAGSGASKTNVGTGAGASAGTGTGTTPATTQKPWTKIYTPTTFQTKYTSAW